MKEKSRQIAIEMAMNNPGTTWGYRDKRNGDYVGEVSVVSGVLIIWENLAGKW